MERNTRLTAKAECLFGKSRNEKLRSTLVIWLLLDTITTIAGILITRGVAVEGNPVIRQIFAHTFKYAELEIWVVSPIIVCVLVIAIVKVIATILVGVIIYTQWKHISRYALGLDILNFVGLVVILNNASHIIPYLFR